MTQTIVFDGDEQEVATEAELLEFANQVRKAGGADPIPELLPSVRSEPNACLIARALNFKSNVDAVSSWISTSDLRYAGLTYEFDDGHPRWGMLIESDSSETVAKAIEQDMGLDILPVSDRDSDAGSWVVILPKHIGLAAEAFDARLAFDEYAER